MMSGQAPTSPDEPRRVLRSVLPPQIVRQSAPVQPAAESSDSQPTRAQAAPETTSQPVPAQAETKSAVRLQDTHQTSQADTDTFGGDLVPVQFRLPAELVKTLKHLSIEDGLSMSELALKTMTTEDFIPRVWMSRRRRAG
jgi:hypothetical protein